MRLTELSLPCNRLVALPAALGNLASLKILDVSFNHLTELPSVLSRLCSLTKLSAESNYPLASIAPAAFGPHMQLHSLHIGYCRQLAAVPPSIAALTRLTLLEIQHTHTELPDTFQHLTSLRAINAHGAHWRAQLPPVMFRQGAQILSLDLSTNALEHLPQGIRCLTALTMLNISDNPLNGVPLNLEGLRQLRVLNISYVGARTLPGSLTRHAIVFNLVGVLHVLGFYRYQSCKDNGLLLICTSAGILCICVCTLSPNHEESSIDGWDGEFALLKASLVRLYCRMKQLENLSVYGNPLGVFPAVLCSMTHLTSLHMAKAGISRIPPELGMLTALEDLYLSYNMINELPSALECLTNLRKLRWVCEPFLASDGFKVHPSFYFLGVTRAFCTARSLLRLA